MSIDSVIGTEGTEMVEKLDAFRSAADALSRYIEREHDLAWLDEVRAGVRRKMAHHTLKEGNERLPPVTPDRPPPERP